MKSLDILLKMDIEKLRLPEKEVKAKRLSEIAGEDVNIKIRALTPDEMEEIQQDNIDMETGSINISNVRAFAVLKGVIEPDLRNKELQKKFKAETPKELIKMLFLPGETDKLYDEIQKLSGYTKDSIEDLKNE